MRAGMKRAICLVLILVLLNLGAAALADEPLARTFYVSLSACEDGSSMPADAVMWQRVGNKYYLFLPGEGDLSEARLWFGTGKEVTLNGQILRNGDRITDLQSNGTINLRYLNSFLTLS